MRPHAGRLRRIVLLAYPASFRRDYGAEVLRCIEDLHRHDGIGRGRLALLVSLDVLLTAPRMRMETLMTRMIAFTLTVSAVLLASLLISPIALTAVPVLVVLMALGVRRDLPLAADDPRRARSRAFIFRGVAALAIAAALLLVNGGGELSEPLWAIWALSFLTGVSLVVMGLVLRFTQDTGGGRVA